MNIGVVGCGYVGLTNASVWVEKHSVGLWDSNIEKIENIKSGRMPYADKLLEKKYEKICEKFCFYDTFVDFIDNNSIFILAISTDICEKNSELVTIDLENIIKEIIDRKEKKNDNDYYVIIKSTIPIGFVDRIRNIYGIKNIGYIPEFLREGHAYYDCIHPNRIVVGDDSPRIRVIIDEFLNVISEYDKEFSINVLYVSAKESECIKLFSNAYLAMRVAFFNEVDSVAEEEKINTKNVIDGICGDKRIGDYYNNPSFGYGGYCLPKDTKALSSFSGKLKLIKAIVDSNEFRKDCIAETLSLYTGKIGIYKLNMKYDSENKRGSSLAEIVKKIIDSGIQLMIYDPSETENGKEAMLCYVNSLEELNEKCEIIVSNRMYPELEKYADKVYTRDIYRRD